MYEKETVKENCSYGVLMPSMKEIHRVSEVSQSSTEDVTISNIFEVRSLLLVQFPLNNHR